MNLGDLTHLVEKPFAAVSNMINTPNSAGRYRPFYLRNLLDAVQGRKLSDAVGARLCSSPAGRRGSARPRRTRSPRRAARWCWSRALWKISRRLPTTFAPTAATPTYPCDLSDTEAIATMADKVLEDLGGSTS